MRIIIDGNSYLNASLLGGKDPDNGRTVHDEAGKAHHVNGHQWGVDKFFDRIQEVCEKFSVAPIDMVLVWDGRNSKSRRQALLPQYKAGRDKLPEVSEELNIAREKVERMMLGLGACVMSQGGLEADDVIGYLVRELRDQPNVVCTDDGDLNVLVDSNTSVWRLGKMNVNPYGPFPHRHITLYKAIVGDASDKIPGAKGFGDAAWCDLIRIFGLDSLDDFVDMVVEGKLDELKDNVPDLKSLQRVIDSKDQVTVSWNCAKLHVDEVNTKDRPLTIQAGMVQQYDRNSADQAHNLKRYYGTKTLVTAGNYADVFARFKTVVGTSPFVALDIETSSSDQSDEWEESRRHQQPDKKHRFDVLGHELTGMSLTFGDNCQHTIYMSVDHADSDNITVEQCRNLCEQIPQSLHTVIQNRNFEFSVLYRTWGEKWKDNGWSGFIPNALDTKIEASYVDENVPKGLKERSLRHLGYTQQTFEEVTQISGPVGTLTGGQVVEMFDKVVTPAVHELEAKESVDPDTGEITTIAVEGKVSIPAVTEKWETRSYKMRELSAKHVFNYGCDDTICTAALHSYYRLVMELEHTWKTYLEVEQLPEYLTSLAYVQGIPLDLGVTNEMSKRDDEAYDKAWATLREFLMRNGWTGTVCPEFEGDIEPSDVKLVAEVLGFTEFTTKKRKLNAMAQDIREQLPDNATASVFATIVERNDVNALNNLVKVNFTGEPAINFDSPKQMQNLFYRVIGMTPRLVNKMTEKQRQNDPVMASAFKKRRQIKEGKTGIEYTPEEREALISKSSVDDTAVDTALALDTDLAEGPRNVLKAFQKIKQVMTRRKLYYVPYRILPHWRDGLIHPSLNQSEAVTRRYSASDPNVQQQPAHGEGVELRKTIKAKNKDHVVVSMDFSGQELRIQAEESGDEALTSCYVGDNLRDMHTLTAVSAAVLVLHKEITYEQFVKNLKSDDPVVAEEASATRKNAKTVNFAAAYGAMADTVAVGLKSTPEVAQQFLDARSAAFPGLAIWVEKLERQIMEQGYSTTMMGARRHLREALTSDNKWDHAGALRQGVNHRIQGSAGEQTKLAMARMWKAGLFTGKYDAQFYFPVHDELVSSVHRDQAIEFIQEAHALMVMPYSYMKIPVVSSIAIGKTFLCEVEIGTVADPELIQKALDKVFSSEAAVV